MSTPTEFRQSRRDLLKGGALLVGFSLLGLPRAAQAVSPGPFPGHVPGKVPDLRQVDAWLVIHADNSVSLLSGRVEIGQGGPQGLLQIAAEELDIAISQIRCGPIETGKAPETGETDASSSIEVAGPLVRQAAAEARLALVTLAAEELGVPASELVVRQGVISASGTTAKAITYGQLVGGRTLNVPITGKAPLKPRSAYRIVGSSVPRLNVREKVTGQFTYMQSLRVPDMLHGRVVRPRGQGPYGKPPRVVSIDESSISHLPGARVVRRNDFVGVVAQREWDAVRAAAALSVKWDTPTGLPGNDALFQAMRSAKSTDMVVERKGDIERAFPKARYIAQGTFKSPYQAHAPFAPNCAIADVRTDSATVHCTTQGIYVTRMEVAKVIDLPLERIVVHHVEGSGTYGPSCYHDVAQAAAILSQAVRKPVRLQFMRWDEFGWDNFGPAHLADIKVCADADGRITGYQYDGWQHGWIGTEMTEELALGTPAPDPKSGPARIVNKANAGAMYDIDNRLLNNHHISGKDHFLRGNPLRSPLDLAISFASEQMVDDLAWQHHADPVEFRRRNLSNPRWLGVLDAVVKAASWLPRRAAAPVAPGAKTAKGRGVALGTHFVSFGAAIADVEVDLESGIVRVIRLFGALDAGLVINPGLVESQILGMLTQTTSRMLKEEVTFDEKHVTSLDWISYPVLRFNECPQITPIVVQRPDDPSTGAGEEVMGAAAGAIANAVFDAIGVRLSAYPMTPERVRAALAARHS
ncbi:molybdopterin-dependent oxidoreductase [Cupriavidus necator]|uniref:xanthine dehydrogenase family protein molybdopterin-binding subunit n=1 Tax=Cupriavidus necator TaxID=106590 RepID=UPI0039C22C74